MNEQTPVPPKDPLHGKTLQAILEFLVRHYGWEVLGKRIKIGCFRNDPSLSSSLVFLRKTPWAREKVENLYLSTLADTASENEVGTPLEL